MTRADTTLTDQLKADTSALHRRTETHPFAESARDGQLSMEVYRGYLRALAIIHVSLEKLLNEAANVTIARVWEPGMARRATIEHDISQLPKGEGEPKSVIEAALTIADDLRLRAAVSPLSLLGYLYVLEGSARGGPVLTDYIKMSLGPRVESACGYFATQGLEWDQRWRRFKNVLNGAVTAKADRAAVLAGAKQAFAAFELVFDACAAAHAEKPIRHLTALNPEAGRHPMPEDPLEIDAAVQAGERCWRRYSYLGARYGERGKRFTASDGAWVVSLVGEDQAEVDRQLDWLASLLAARGLPRLLMEEHLGMLYEELSKARPENQPNYRKLEKTSQRLRLERFEQIDEKSWTELRQWFDRHASETQSLDAESPDNTSGAAQSTASALPDTNMYVSQPTQLADLILSAVTDRRAGLPAGPDSLLPWLLRDEALAPELRAGVEGLIARADAIAGKS